MCQHENYARMRLLIPILFFTASCSSKFIAKFDLVKPWTEQLASEKHLEEPYVARFKSGDAALTYVAVRHQYGVASKTFRTIDRAFSDVKPRIIIIEGASDLNEHKRHKIEQQTANCGRGNFSKCGENYYGVFLALKNGVLWTSGEPSEKSIRHGLSQHYADHDVAFFYLVRQVRQLVVEKGLNTRNFESVVNDALADFAINDELPPKLTAKMFLAWYEEKMHKPFVLAEINSETTAPTFFPQMTYLNQISAEIEKIRDRHILKTIANELNSHRNVLVIYGGSHFLTQYDALVDMMGIPTIMRYQ